MPAAAFRKSTTISVFFTNGDRANRRRRFFSKTVSAVLLFVFAAFELFRLSRQAASLEETGQDIPVSGIALQEAAGPFPVVLGYAAAVGVGLDDPQAGHLFDNQSAFSMGFDPARIYWESPEN